MAKRGERLSEEAKKKITEGLKQLYRNGYVSPMLGKQNKWGHHTEESKKKLRLSLKGRVGGMKGKHHTEQWKRNMSEKLKGNNNPRFGKHLSEEHKQKLSKANMGKYGYWNNKKFSKEHINNLIKSHIGKKHSNEQNKKISLSNKGRHCSEETKKRMGLVRLGKHYIKLSESKKGHSVSNETRQKIKLARIKQVFPLKDSSIEIIIQNFLKQLQIPFFTHQYINIEHAYQCDILIPSLNLVIECDGIYWHHYPFGNEIDHVRTSELLQKGFKVLRLWEHEIRKMQLEDFKNEIKYFEGNNNE